MSEYSPRRDFLSKYTKDPKLVIQNVRFFILKKLDYHFGLGKSETEKVINNTIWSSKLHYGPKNARLFIIRCPTSPHDGADIHYNPIVSQNSLDFFHTRGPKEGIYNMVAIYHSTVSLDIFITDDFFSDDDKTFRENFSTLQISRNSTYTRLFLDNHYEHYRFLVLACILHICFPIQLTEIGFIFSSRFYFLKNMNYTQYQVINPALNGLSLTTNVNQFWHSNLFGMSFFSGFVSFLENIPPRMQGMVVINDLFPILYQYRQTAGFHPDSRYTDDYLYPEDLRLALSQIHFLKDLSNTKVFYFDPKKVNNAGLNYSILNQISPDSGHISEALYAPLGDDDTIRLLASMHAIFMGQEAARSLQAASNSAESSLQVTSATLSDQAAESSDEGERNRARQELVRVNLDMEQLAILKNVLRSPESTPEEKVTAQRTISDLYTRTPESTRPKKRLFFTPEEQGKIDRYNDIIFSTNAPQSAKMNAYQLIKKIWYSDAPPGTEPPGSPSQPPGESPPEDRPTTPEPPITGQPHTPIRVESPFEGTPFVIPDIVIPDVLGSPSSSSDAPFPHFEDYFPDIIVPEPGPTPTPSPTPLPTFSFETIQAMIRQSELQLTSQLQEIVYIIYPPRRLSEAKKVRVNPV